MGDMSELRGLLVVVCFLGCFLFFASTIPVAFLQGQAPNIDSPFTVPDQFRATSILKYDLAQSKNFTLLNEAYGDTGVQEFGGWYIMEWWSNIEGYKETGMSRWENWWVFWWIAERWGQWYDYQNYNFGTTLTEMKMDSDFLANQGNLDYLVKFSVTEFHVIFAFNQDLDDLPSEAWTNNRLYVIWGIEWDQVKTSYSAFDLIGMLLMFNLPNVEPALNYLLGLMVWVPVAYITFIIVLRIIGAVFGGGGA